MARAPMAQTITPVLTPGVLLMSRVLEATMESIGSEPISAAELRERDHFRCSFKALSRRLATLFQQGEVDRRWDGNGRFGRYVYFRKG